MKKQFKTMNELIEYLEGLENRIEILENEKSQLQKKISPKQQFPKTNLLNTNFLKRAFTVWGHFFVANLILSIIGAGIYFCVIVIFLQLILGSITPNPVTIPTPIHIPFP